MTLTLAKELIRRASVTPEDAGCQQLIADILKGPGYNATHLRFVDVDNLWLTHGSGDPVLVFAGHTDVVPAGETAQWNTAPFEPVVRNGYLYGRGAADMKGSVAAMVNAIQTFVTLNPEHRGTLALLLTSDEEGHASNGTRKVIDYLNEQNIRITWCLVGEPSSRESTGDVIKNGRRGSLNATLTVYGIQGHVAHPAKAKNPVHLVMPALIELCNKVWDIGNQYYPPTSFQISNINAGTGADNVIPGTVEILFNFRYSTETNPEKLSREVEAILDRHQIEYRIDWRLSGNPFLTESGVLLESVISRIQSVTGITPQLATDGGTSDGRFIAPTGAEVVELGPVNDTIHKVNECVSIDDLDTLATIYTGIMQDLLA
jgi:succinyl-diaminopimelate desuccinylase